MRPQADAEFGMREPTKTCLVEREEVEPGGRAPRLSLADLRLATLPPIAWRPLLIVAAVTLLVHLLCIDRYGFFRDELYYLACSKRLDWGYVDQPPLSIALLRMVTAIFGDSLAAVRAAPVFTGLATIAVVGLIAREMGGGKFAQTLAALAVAVSPVYRVVSHVYSMNGLDVLLWAASALIFLRLLKQDTLGLWLALGAVCGIAFLNKVGILWLGAGVGLGLLLTDKRRLLLTICPWAALALATAIAAPYVVWQSQHSWATVEFVRNATKYKLVPTPPWLFLATQVVVMNPATAPLWVVGALGGVFHPAWKRWRPMAIVFLTVVAILLASGRARENYLSPAFPFVLGVGAVAIEGWMADRHRAWRRVVVGVTAVLGIATSLLALPILSPQTFIKVVGHSPVEPPAAERGEKSPLQGFADMYGWPEMAARVGQVYASLSPADRIRCAVLTNNYGEASAIDHFGPERGLPTPICGHNNFWLWGPDGWLGDVAILVGDWPKERLDDFESVQKVGEMNSLYAVPEERDAPIYLARRLRVSVPAFWRSIRLFM